MAQRCGVQDQYTIFDGTFGLRLFGLRLFGFPSSNKRFQARSFLVHLFHCRKTIHTPHMKRSGTLLKCTASL